MGLVFLIGFNLFPGKTQIRQRDDQTHDHSVPAYCKFYLWFMKSGLVPGKNTVGHSN